jgi:hypothetical protein
VTGYEGSPTMPEEYMPRVSIDVTLYERKEIFQVALCRGSIRIIEIRETVQATREMFPLMIMMRRSYEKSGTYEKEK